MNIGSHPKLALNYMYTIDLKLVWENMYMIQKLKSN